MKKWLICLLIALLTLTVFSVSAFADGEATVSITADTTSFTLEKGQTQDVTLTFHVENNTGKLIDSLQFDVSYPHGFTYKSSKDLSGADNARYDDGTKRYAFSRPNGNSGNWDAFELVLTIDGSAAKENDTSKIEITGNLVLQFIEKDQGTLHGTPIEITVKHAADAHDYTDGAKVEASCTKGGSVVKHCKCGYEYTEYSDPLGHLNLTAENFTFDSPSADSSDAKIKVKCEREGCDYYGGGDGVTLVAGTNDEVTADADYAEAKCGTTGTVTWNAKLEIEDKNQPDGTGKLIKEGSTTCATGGVLKHKFDSPPTGAIHQAGETVTGSKVCTHCKQTFFGKGEAKEVVEENAKCEATGKSHLEVELVFTPGEGNDANAWEENDLKDTVKTGTVTTPALGHDWDTANAEWTWGSTDSDPDNNNEMTASVKVKCKREGCDGNGGAYATEGLELTATVTNNTKKPTCDTQGEATFKATAHTQPDSTGNEPDVTLTQDDPAKETYDPLGHAWSQVDADVTVTWDGEAPDFTGSKATRTCTRDATHTQDSTSFTVKEDTQNPTYTENGRTTYEVEFTFPADQTYNQDNTEWKYTDKTQYKDIPMLEPDVTVETPANNAGAENVDPPETDALPSAEDVKKMVEAAIAGGNTGLDDTLEAALVGAAKNESDDMTVRTQLVIDDKNKQPSVGTPVDGNETIESIYDIYIKVTVNGGGISNKEGYIHETAQSLGFDIKKEGNGPIYVVKRYHGTDWTVIPSSVNGDWVHFDSSQFSEFALLSSNDLKYATIEPIPDQTYTGSAIQPKLTVYINGDKAHPLEEGVDYTVEYGNNVNVGSKTATATIKFVADGKYSGEQTVNFSIVAKPAASGSGTKNAPNTGDETPVALYAGILTLSVSALAVVCIRRKKSH